MIISSKLYHKHEYNNKKKLFSKECLATTKIETIFFQKHFIII
jgi:hypothetical protein